ncbi:MAG: hypothetical protein U1E97_00930 [Alphaproteobacteria bacterium]
MKTLGRIGDNVSMRRIPPVCCDFHQQGQVVRIRKRKRRRIVEAGIGIGRQQFLPGVHDQDASRQDAPATARQRRSAPVLRGCRGLERRSSRRHRPADQHRRQDLAPR